MTNTNQIALEKLIALAKRHDARALLMRIIQPVGHHAVVSLVASEVEELTGYKHTHRDDTEPVRWGYNTTSLWIGEQKIALKVARLRGKKSGSEVKLKSLGPYRKKFPIQNSDLMAVLKLLSRGQDGDAILQILKIFGVDLQKLPPNFFKAASNILRSAVVNPATPKPVALVLDDMGLNTQGFAVISLAANGTCQLRFHLDDKKLNQTGLRKLLHELRRHRLAPANNLPIIVKGQKQDATLVLSIP